MPPLISLNLQHNNSSSQSQSLCHLLHTSLFAIFFVPQLPLRLIVTRQSSVPHLIHLSSLSFPFPVPQSPVALAHPRRLVISSLSRRRDWGIGSSSPKLQFLVLLLP
ncbi:hypothetical protein Pint_27709 [Pistacia integerrima]|uniref:Uncharacterized protein n=1 Tax=Pistacia integerrima TaxID=434235 RepID=A0ACC0YU43_9ROSI|nr:hypothetical protein Pint_27709 [Pistacia integerrima]